MLNLKEEIQQYAETTTNFQEGGGLLTTNNRLLRPVGIGIRRSLDGTKVAYSLDLPNKIIVPAAIFSQFIIDEMVGYKDGVHMCHILLLHQPDATNYPNFIMGQVEHGIICDCSISGDQLQLQVNGYQYDIDAVDVQEFFQNLGYEVLYTRQQPGIVVKHLAILADFNG